MNAMPLTGSETIRLLESSPVNTLLSVVQAMDADVGENAEISYQITAGNELGKDYICNPQMLYSLYDG